MILSPTLKHWFPDANGNPLAGGKVYAYIAGTTTLQATYSNQSGTENTNPIILDASGFCSLWLDPTLAYKFVVKDSNDVTQYTVDQVTSAGLTGAPGWNSTSSYDEGSIVADASGAGLLYVSRSDNNVGNALSNVTYWRMFMGAVRTITSSDAATISDDLIRSNSTAGAVTVTLPACATTAIGKRITVKDVGTGGFTTSVRGAGTDTVDGDVTYATALRASESLTVMNTGTRWDALGVFTADNSTIEKSTSGLRVKDAGITAAKIADGAVTASKLSAMGQVVSGASGSYTNASTTPADVTNLSVTVTATGRPVMLFLQPDGGSGGANVGASNGTLTSQSGGIRILRDGSTIANFYVDGGSGASSGGSQAPGSIQFLDTGATAGSHTYKVQAWAVVGGGGISSYVKVTDCVLVAVP
jgi:hypothetical protein